MNPDKYIDAWLTNSWSSSRKLIRGIGVQDGTRPGVQLVTL